MPPLVLVKLCRRCKASFFYASPTSLREHAPKYLRVRCLQLLDELDLVLIRRRVVCPFYGQLVLDLCLRHGRKVNTIRVNQASVAIDLLHVSSLLFHLFFE